MSTAMASLRTLRALRTIPFRRLPLLSRLMATAAAAIVPTPTTYIPSPSPSISSPPILPTPHPKQPPNHTATTGNLSTFTLPTRVTGSPADIMLGCALISAFRQDGILQIRTTAPQQAIVDSAFAASRLFFGRPHAEKAALVDRFSYGGYIASGEEITDGIADYSEVYTVTKDIKDSDPRSQVVPCHGKQPWPSVEFKQMIGAYQKQLGEAGDILLGLIELGLGVKPGSLTGLAQDGWHHLRVLRFPQCNRTNGKGKAGRGIGSHTDYGMLVIASQDSVGGLLVRPPRPDEKTANWQTSAAGLHENASGWVFVPPEGNVFTVFPGDMLQYMTGHYLPSTPHMVGLNTAERFAFAYFHEPHFDTVVKPLDGFDAGQTPREGIHYGTHFTNMFKRNYPDRATTLQLNADGREELLKKPEYRRQ